MGGAARFTQELPLPILNNFGLSLNISKEVATSNSFYKKNIPTNKSETGGWLIAQRRIAPLEQIGYFYGTNYMNGEEKYHVCSIQTEKLFHKTKAYYTDGSV